MLANFRKKTDNSVQWKHTQHTISTHPISCGHHFRLLDTINCQISFHDDLSYKKGRSSWSYFLTLLNFSSEQIFPCKHREFVDRLKKLNIHHEIPANSRATNFNIHLTKINMLNSTIPRILFYSSSLILCLSCTSFGSFSKLLIYPST